MDCFVGTREDCILLAMTGYYRADMKAKDHSKEDIFLISLLKESSGGQWLDTAAVAGLDWGYLVEKARDEGVFYPFYKKVTLLPGWQGLFSDEGREQFDQTYYSHLSASTEFSAQVSQTLYRLDSMDIRTLLFKGPAIDALIYDGFVRPRLDLDIAVGDKDISRAVNAFPGPKYELRPHIHRHIINNTFLTFDGALHMDMKRVWQETEPFSDYRNIYSLKPEMNILYLCEHGLKHDFSQLVFVYEIDRLLRHYSGSFDWRKFISLAEEFGLKRVVYYGLYFTCQIMSGDIPKEVLESLAPAATSGEKAFVKAVLGNRQARYSSYVVYLATRKGLLSKAYFIFRSIFPIGLTLTGHVERARRLILR